MATNALVNQLALEGVLGPNPNAEINQLVIETILDQVSHAKINQLVVEALTSLSVQVQINQLVVEAITAFAPPVTSILGGFALIASVVNTADALLPAVSLSVPNGSTIGQTTPFYWSAVGVTYYRITGTNGYDSGFLSATESSGVLYVAPFESSGTYVFTIYGLDSTHTAVATATIVLTIQS